MKRERKSLVGLAGALLVGLVGVATVESAPAAFAAAATLFGVHEFNVAAQPGRPSNDPDRVPLIRDSGAQIVRMPISWHLMEGGGKDQTPDWYWSELDADVAAAEQAGVELIITLGQTPCWASSDPLKDCAGSDDTYLHYRPTNLADYGDALARLASRYRGRVYAWEIWNEPNISGGFRRPECGGTGVDRGKCFRPAAQNDSTGLFDTLDGARQYAEMAKLAWDKVKAVDPGATILAGSIAGSDTAWLQTLYDSGLAGRFSAISTHPYTAPTPNDPQGRIYGPSACYPGTSDAPFWCMKSGVEAMHAVMTANRDLSKMWFTEFGASSSTGWNGAGLTGQADYLREAVSLIRSWDFVPVAIWYQLADRGSDQQGQFGLYSAAGSVKPSGAAFRELMAVAPTAPTALTATSAGAAVNLAWTDNATNETGYEIQRARWVAGVWSEWATIAGSAGQVTYKDLNRPDGFYAYLVRAKSAAGSSAWAVAVVEHTTAAGPPTAPGNVAASNVGQSVRLTWADRSTSEHRFDIQRARYNPSTQTWSEWVSWAADIDATTFTDTTVGDGQYAYLVRAVNPFGPSAWGIAVVLHTNSTAVPAAPVGIAASRSGNDVNVSWTDAASNEIYVEVQRARWTGTTWSEWKSWALDKNASSYVDLSVSTGRYAYIVRAVNANGSSEAGIVQVDA